ncbi:LytR/AlgR family response regulator transcription factor [Butyrivibrio sp. YAB3001]|uniref:LytR/AlgR family response regulator transcription factor n=1 Tax=Butyrivibrio sp. YAB3001 TaxID=1520812 RepID=UPI0008F67447|nr:LytTR family DNA-binding domain-containing protein [Butyrivibrio sp. YAB3001]SFC12450.1 two component transcriptional regulator, LytTR family [Butyrivibrio sp. YAB3001]
MGIRIAVCDDEKMICHQITRMLDGSADKYTIDYFESGEKLIQSGKKYDILFLDIEMGMLNGLRTAAHIRKQGRNDYIIFLTSHIEFMSEAFKVRAFRFLSKPIQPKAFYEALSEAEKELIGEEKIIVNSNGNKYIVVQSDIVYVESMGDGTCIYTADNQYMNNKTLKYWESTLNPDLFYKTHKTYLVSFKYVKVVQQNEVVLSIDDELAIPVSRRQKADFVQRYMKYAKEHAISY